MSVIRTLIAYTFTTGLFTTLVAAAGLVLVRSISDKSVSKSALTESPTSSEAELNRHVSFCGSTILYASGLLASLNRRDKMRKEIAPSSGIITVPLGHDLSELEGHSTEVSRESLTDVVIDICTSTESSSDGVSEPVDEDIQARLKPNH
ncbi:hypothetical protein JR316_0002823 [Psilocybe cubensis]|uniref:Uncharacterized protein n=1 Tax=Psilocybe cubensis TaxID=181762 RepID=A0ACB8HEL2_PSICU|nr:hypothetical protein JR316_0002823 [Psilocybe cubensis]KAH9485906.1 hypothetical protein JR316_0002823 [Psilocybe cubensis]